MGNRDTPAYREIAFRYDTETREMRLVYDPDGEVGRRKDVVIKSWCGHATFYVDESRAAGYPRWLIAVIVRGTPPDDLEVTYELVDVDIFQ